MFNKGDILECINDHDATVNGIKALTKGKFYISISDECFGTTSLGNMIKVVDDTGGNHNWFCSRFSNKGAPTATTKNIDWSALNKEFSS